MTAIILFGTMIVLLIIGVPISVSLGAATMASLLCFDVPMAVVPQRMFTALDSVSIMAIPLFVLAGNLMTEGGISRRLVDFLSGVAYANNGQIKRVANSTFIITPYNVDIMGDLLDELENNGAFY